MKNGTVQLKNSILHLKNDTLQLNNKTLQTRNIVKSNTKSSENTLPAVIFFFYKTEHTQYSVNLFQDYVICVKLDFRANYFKAT